MSDAPPHQMPASAINILTTVGLLIKSGHSLDAIAQMTNDEMAAAIDAAWRHE